MFSMCFCVYVVCVMCAAAVQGSTRCTPSIYQYAVTTDVFIIAFVLFFVCFFFFFWTISHFLHSSLVLFLLFFQALPSSLLYSEYNYGFLFKNITSPPHLLHPLLDLNAFFFLDFLSLPDRVTFVIIQDYF